MAVDISSGNPRFSPAHWTPWQKWLAAFLWLSIASVAVLLAVIPVSELSLLWPALERVRYHVPPEKALYAPLTYLLLLTVVFWLEIKIPARDQRVFSISFWHDLSWYVARVIGFAFLMASYVLILQAIYDQYFDFLTIDAVSSWHPVAKFLVAVLLLDFLRYCTHFIRHKVSVFWEFHAVHHSQKELNLFTDARLHPFDYMIAQTIRFIPMLMFQNAFPVIILWAIFDTVYPKFYHANVRLNLGPLRYVLVTPQSHRVHHSREPEHRDKNFGFIFCIWDRLFGTHWTNDEVYPETGIEDVNFPHETKGGVFSILSTMVSQLIYPFTAIYRMSLTRLRVRED
jgi:sterol desaturase/sphingolipid hydroxylase (fatty acid hydroxylase superfamily)